jgi:hypothetical protein
MPTSTSAYTAVVRSAISRTVCQFVSIAPIVAFQRRIANLYFM